jgi:hypothetical protein
MRRSEWAVGRIGDSPGSVFALLLNIAWKMRSAGEDDRAIPEPDGGSSEAGAGVAGYNLHEYHPLLDAQWLADADRLFDHDPDGAWGIFECRPRCTSRSSSRRP